jgi:hypothetical protein
MRAAVLTIALMLTGCGLMKESEVEWYERHCAPPAPPKFECHFHPLEMPGACRMTPWDIDQAHAREVYESQRCVDWREAKNKQVAT